MSPKLSSKVNGSGRCNSAISNALLDCIVDIRGIVGQDADNQVWQLACRLLALHARATQLFRDDTLTVLIQEKRVLLKACNAYAKVSALNTGLM